MMNRAEDIAESRERVEFWMKVAAWAFGLWSVMIPLGVVMLQNSVDRVVKVNEAFSLEFNQYVLSMERRVTIIEERQQSMLESFRDHQQAGKEKPK